ERAAPVRRAVNRACAAGRQPAVTGPLPAGTIAVGDERLLRPAGRRVRVRTIGCAGARRDAVGGVSRVVLTLRDAGRVDAGMALVTPAAWSHTPCVDVRTRLGEEAGRHARRITRHISPAPAHAPPHPPRRPSYRL